MKRAWTEGPWVADELGMEDDRRVRVATTDGTPLYYHRSATICEAYVTHPALGDDLSPGEPEIGIITAEANARLIAAAPELYEALSGAADELLVSHGQVANPEDPDGWDDSDIYRVWYRAVAALKKATAP